MSEQLPLLDPQQLQAAASLPPTASWVRRRKKQQCIGRATIGFGVALFATLALMAAVSWSSTKSASSVELETIMDDYRAQQFSGVVRLTHNGARKFSDWMGLANEEFDVPMQKHSVFPIGSNSKLFTSVAMYQLQEQGRVSLSSPVNEYLDQADFANFGFANQSSWCPRVAEQSGSESARCENVTFVQLLSMGSGIRGDDYESTAAVPPVDLAHYRGSIAKHVGAFINAPLAFLPGTNYSYANANYVLLSYLIEKLSGQKLETYLSERIFQPMELKKTYYDPFSGGRLVHKGFVNQYANFYTKPSPQKPGATEFETETGAYDDTQQQPAARKYLATGTCGPTVNSGALSGAGGIHSTVKDMHRVYKDLFLYHGTQSKVLSEASIRAMLLTRNPVRSSYAQGINVAFDSDNESQQDWPSKISYCGRLKCTVTCMAMQLVGDDSFISSAFTNHVEYTFSNSDAFAQWQPSDDLVAAEPVGSSNTSAVSFEVGDYQVAELSWALLDVFLRYLKATEDK